MGDFKLEEEAVVSVSANSLGEAEVELGECWLAGCCGEKASLLSSSKL